jgi:hypothetical protein
MSTAPNEFTFNVEGVGTFTLARRNMRRESAVGAEFSRLTEGVETPSPWLSMVAGWISALKVLTLKAPDDWNIDELDPLEEDSYAKLGKVHAALREKEDSFRGKANKPVEGSGAANGEVNGVLVSPQVQLGADGPALS